MSSALLFLLALGLGLAGWLAARAKAWSFRKSPETQLASLPLYHGWYVALWIIVPTVLFVIAWGAMRRALLLSQCWRPRQQKTCLNLIS